MAEILEPGAASIKPQMDKDKAAAFALNLYGMKAIKMKEFVSYDDRNYFFQVDPEADIDNPNLSASDINPDGYILKVTNSLDSKDPKVLEAQNAMIMHMSQHGLEVPVPTLNKNGNYTALEELINDNDDQWSANNEVSNDDTKKSWHIVRLLKFIPGKTLYNIEPWLPRHFYEAGIFAAKMDMSLKTFHHEAYDSRQYVWFMSSMPQVKKFLHAVQDEDRKKMCEEIFDAFIDQVLDKSMSQLEVGIIHGDFNEQNILVRPIKDDPNEYEVFSVIDFGDSQKNPLIFELGITTMYMMTQCKVIDPNDVGGHVMAGYQTVRTLPDIEKEILRVTVAARYAQSLVMGAYTYMQDPSNDYVLITAKNGWTQLKNFWNLSQSDLYAKWDQIQKLYTK